MTFEHSLAQRSQLGTLTREESVGNDKDAKPRRSEQVQAAQQKIDVGFAHLVIGIGVLLTRRAALPVRRVRHDQMQAARKTVLLLRDEALKRALYHPYVWPHGPQHGRGQSRVLYRRPVELFWTQMYRQRMNEATDSSAGLKRQQLGMHSGARLQVALHHPRYLHAEHRWRKKLVDQR